VLDAIFYLVRGGIAGAQLPSEFPPVSTVYDFLRRWVAAGAGRQIHDALRGRLRLRAGRDPCPTAAIIDSQTVPAADTVPNSSRGWDGGKVNRRKRHIPVNVTGMVLFVLVTTASMQDRDAGLRLLAGLREASSTIRLIWADAGYRGRLPRWSKRVLNLPIQIIKRLPGVRGFHVRPWVWAVERSFGWITKYRGCVRDYETHTDHQEAMLYLAMTRTMNPRLARG
jgi:transposase